MNKSLFILIYMTSILYACHTELKPGTTFTFYQEIVFDFAAASIDLENSKMGLDSLESIIRKYAKNDFEIQVHTGLRGNANANQILSDARAESLKKYFEQKNGISNRLTFKGYGETSPELSAEEVDSLFDNHGNRKNLTDPRKNLRVVILVK